MEDSCKVCGSEARGRICHFCGTLVGRLESPEAEAEVIAELHVAISAAKDDPARARLLANGPLPDDRDVLIDAALRASQLADPKSYADQTPHAAVRRIEAVRMKLRVLAPGDPVAERAVAELGKKLEAFEADEAREQSEGSKSVLVFLAVAVVLFTGAGVVVWQLLR